MFSITSTFRIPSGISVRQSLANPTASPAGRFLLRLPIGASICRYRSISKFGRIPARGRNEKTEKDFGQGYRSAADGAQVRYRSGCEARHLLHTEAASEAQKKAVPNRSWFHCRSS